ncbi:MAG: hypothetical protein K6F99_01450 [Lachnospiraceae bacterium]|nr:hypothetical protein [Lachnospiraceae bacterium]
MINENIPEDPVERAKWYEEAAAKGDVKAQEMLGDCFYKGIGVEKNLDSALSWYGKAVINGSESAADKVAEINLKQRHMRWM